MTVIPACCGSSRGEKFLRVITWVAEPRVLATQLPRLKADGSVITLEAEISRCKVERVKAVAYPIESQPLLSLATYR